MTPGNPEQPFAEQAALLEGAHDQGRKAFQSAADQVLGFVVDYPTQVLAVGEQHSDGKIVTAYQAVLSGIGKAMPGERLRRDFAQFVNHWLTEDATTERETGGGAPQLKPETSALMLEALHESFPDGVGVVDEGLDFLSATRPRFERADPEEFGAMINKLLSQAQAGTMPKIIEASNTPDRRLEITKGYRYSELTYTQGKQVIAIGTKGTRHFVKKKTIDGKGKHRVVQTLRVRHSDPVGSWDNRQYQSLEGYLKTTEGKGKHKSKPSFDPLKERQIVKVVDTVIGQVWKELTRRSDLHSGRSAEDQVVEDILKE